jgi:hypothetical protein
MENDSIRSSGTNTLVDLWIDGQLRGICVSHQAIGAYLGFDRASAMTEQDRCEFVRNHLPLVVTAVQTILRDGDRTADNVIIDVDELPRPDGKPGDRRKDDRRKTDRRNTARPMGTEPDRRRSARRQGERRSPSPKQDAP